MSTQAPIWTTPAAYLAAERPDGPALFFAPAVLTARVKRYLDGFPGLVSYAVKANSEPVVAMTLLTAGVTAWDVASPAEIALIRGIAPDAALHYHNPVKSRGEIAYALANGVRTFAVDSVAELDKIAAVAADKALEARLEISVRFKLPVAGAIYDFGAKFGATPEAAATLLQRARDHGFDASLTFHPGTQCASADAWVSYIDRAAVIAAQAGVRPARLNVGGGFPAAMYGEDYDLEAIFAAIGAAARRAFGDDHPPLVCEPGRGLVADSMMLAAGVKLVREDGAVFLNDGVYGGLDEMPVLGRAHSFSVLTPEGARRDGPTRPAILFGPTCDSVDRLPGEPETPCAIAEDDYILFDAMGAYGSVTATGFNGYGALRTVAVHKLC